MTPRPIYLLDQANHKVAALNVSATGTHYEGTIVLDQTPPELRRLFEEFEEVVEGQMFSLLDGIEEKIRSNHLKVSFESGMEASIENLQVYPSTGAVSFITRQLTEV